MLAALVVVLRSLALICRGHRAVALENVALRQQLAVFRRTVKRPPQQILWHQGDHPSITSGSFDAPMKARAYNAE